MIFYPFNRLIKTNSSETKNILTITGQFITEIGIRPDPSRGYDPEFDFDSQNPQIFHESYLMRYELEQLTNWTIDYLKNKKKRSADNILRALQIVREEIWRAWDEAAQYSEEITCYYTGSQSEPIGPKSFRTWVIYSDPQMCLESASDDWLQQNIWRVDNQWTWAEIYGIVALWMIDEATVYLNLGKPYKATTWLLRADQYTHWYLSYEKDSFSTLASLGGQAKRDSYKPLIDFVINKVKSKKYPSRRNAALSLAPEVLQLAKQLNISLSEQQAHLTIATWLKRVGLPANI